MMCDLNGRTALVTGGVQGVGKAIAMVFAEQGADVAIGDIQKDLLPGVVKEIEGLGRRALGLEMDVRSRDSVDAALSRILSEWSHLDILVNNAGVVGEDWNQIFETNLMGVINCCDAVMPHMMERRYGKIINISSTAGKPGHEMLYALQMPSSAPSPPAHPSRTRPHFRTGNAYGVLKAAVIRLSQSLAAVAARNNINVNCICPTAMVTPMGIFLARGGRTDMSEEEAIERRRKSCQELNMFGRELLPLDVAKMVAFLVSEDARNITGQSINVGGRLTS